MKTVLKLLLGIFIGVALVATLLAIEAWWNAAGSRRSGAAGADRLNNPATLQIYLAKLEREWEELDLPSFSYYRATLTFEIHNDSPYYISNGPTLCVRLVDQLGRLSGWTFLDVRDIHPWSSIYVVDETEPEFERVACWKLTLGGPTAFEAEDFLAKDKKHQCALRLFEVESSAHRRGVEELYNSLPAFGPVERGIFRRKALEEHLQWVQEHRRKLEAKSEKLDAAQLNRHYQTQLDAGSFQVQSTEGSKTVIFKVEQLGRWRCSY